MTADEEGEDEAAEVIDLADRLDDLICAFDEVVGGNGDSAFVTVIFGWLAFAAVAILAAYFLLRDNTKSYQEPRQRFFFSFYLLMASMASKALCDLVDWNLLS